MQWSAAELRPNVACRAAAGGLVGTGRVVGIERALAVFLRLRGAPGTAYLAPEMRKTGWPPRTPEDPPSPPCRGQDTDSILVEDTYVTERGRKRRRLVPVDLAAVRARLAAGSEADRTAWEQVRMPLLQTVGESTFEIWLERLELIAVDDRGTLIVSAPDATVSWIRQRFGRLLNRAAEAVGRPLRMADEVELKAAQLRPASDSRR
jgi:DnaA N-terminal domain